MFCVWKSKRSFDQLEIPYLPRNNKCEKMGAEESKAYSPVSSRTSSVRSCPGIDFPNHCRREQRAWSLLHQCTLEKWKEGHADAAGFKDTMLNCDGSIHKDCSPAFCINRQGIININKTSSIFSFRRRSKFTKMAEHFEYNHIPAQLSSVQNFHVKSVLGFRANLVVLHLVRNMATQFGLLDIKDNKFKGVFGKKSVEFNNDVVTAALSPDNCFCLIKVPYKTGSIYKHRLELYNIESKQHITMVSSYDLPGEHAHFCFDPRFSSSRIAVTNIFPDQVNSLSLVQTDNWSILATNTRVDDTRQELYPNLTDLMYTKDGTLVVAIVLDLTCHCREKKTMRNYRPVDVSVFIFNADTTSTLHCMKYKRYTCGQHLCPVNYMPIFSQSSNRIGIVANIPDIPDRHYVQVYKLPAQINLQSLCRIVILDTFNSDAVPKLPLPPKLINYLNFVPEFH
ncbi:unnamed protein product [Owenia fusiformis]|uniref:Uncharacterized protein n=1 Tax=Owenia fusiformis TaxID=6347 RepID=A0A8J1U8B7_OWEFU|nr:unnamed protein product [Owenia fusiformis]